MIRPLHRHPCATVRLVILLQFIGGGKMAEALLGGLIGDGWASASALHVVEPSAPRRAALTSLHPDISVGAEPHRAVDAVIAVKPDIVAAVLPVLAAAGVNRVLSIAAGVTVSAMEAGLGSDVAVVRCMPNTPALVGKGAAAIAPGTKATPEDLAWASSILAAVGSVVVVDEADMDAVTGLSGSGPAYVFQLAEALIAAGIAEGLPPEVADALTRQTILGAATLLAQSGEDPASLRTNVTSPGGTTAAGLAVLGKNDFVGLVRKVVGAAATRSRELGG